ncbi:MAG: sigma-70 family RNA polymerase sigma factor [Bryobacteraceae bacterium]|jgi:RNA polymerase sigma factor (TIGR02999 family)
MNEDQIAEFLGLLRSYDPDNEAEVNRLAQLIYPDLRRVAAGLLRDERNIGVSLQATMLASDSIMRLIVKNRVEPKDYPHFLSIAAAAMRQMLVDHIRRKRAQRRPSSGRRVELDDGLALAPQVADEVMDLHEAIERLGSEYREVLVMHYFGGASVNELAARFGVSDRTIKRKLDVARLRLRALLKPGRSGS